MKEQRGKWFFVCSYIVTIGAPRIQAEEAELTDVATEEDAYRKGQELWRKKIKEAEEAFEEKKRTWEKPPKSAFEDGPFNPRVIYKIPLGDDKK